MKKFDNSEMMNYLLAKGHNRFSAGMVLDNLLILQDKMQDEVVSFMFDYKPSERHPKGESRLAFGTRNPDIISRHHGDPKGRKDRKETIGLFVYFDVQRKDWRSFCVERLTNVDTNFII